MYDIRPTAAVRFREALEAAANGQGANAVAALMQIDADSWLGLENRLAALGTNVGAVFAQATSSAGGRQ